mgnify:CR=1 FL=1
MFIGTQNRVTTDAGFRQFAQLGITHVCADPEGNPHDWTLDTLQRHRDRLAACGLQLDMVQLPLESMVIERQNSPDILTAGPDRDLLLLASRTSIQLRDADRKIWLDQPVQPSDTWIFRPNPDATGVDVLILSRSGIAGHQLHIPDDP